MDLQSVQKRIDLWKQVLPRVDMFYAVKTNPDAQILATLRRNNCNFDCASMDEIRKALELRATPDQIIFANPCKSLEAIAYAKERGVKLMTFDCKEEAGKIH